MKISIVTPVGPGHQIVYAACLESIKNAWDHDRGPFTALDIETVWDLAGEHGRSACRNQGIREARRKGADWLFFLDADDLMSPYAFAESARYVDGYDAIWGNICEARFDSAGVTLRENQLVQSGDIDEILNTDPYLTLQMGHFVRAECAAAVGFDESMDTGEDFRYYLKLWRSYRCGKVPSVFFINRRGRHSTGPRSADGLRWRTAVEAELAAARAARNTQPENPVPPALPDRASRMIDQISRGKTAVVVAHPDDELLWAGGLLARHPGLDIICCSIPARDPQRAMGFFNAMKQLGHHPFMLPFQEKDANTPLQHLDLLPLQNYDTIITHNEAGEYGHLHHKQVHEFVSSRFSGNIYTFGPAGGEIALELSEPEKSRRIAALQSYDHQSPSDAGLPKWQALLNRYKINLGREHFSMLHRAAESSACNGLSNAAIRERSDYQIFRVEQGRVADPCERLQRKMTALAGVLPPLQDQRVLDIGCDFGFWSFLAAAEGAEVIGLDRSREVRGLGRVNIPLLNNQTAREHGLNAGFLDYEAGRQWWDFQPFDVVLCMSLYHHIFNLCGDHEAIWYWLARITRGTLIWENPLDTSDVVVQMNLARDLWPRYREDAIRSAALKYFDIDYEGPAVHEVTRSVWRLTPRSAPSVRYRAAAASGAGGASRAFLHADGRRIDELQHILGKRMQPGSLNLVADRGFDWNSNYFRARLLDLVDRRSGLDGAWSPRWARFYPLVVAGHQAWAMRFEGERYPDNFVELISDRPLRPLLAADGQVELTIAQTSALLKAA